MMVGHCPHSHSHRHHRPHHIHRSGSESSRDEPYPDNGSSGGVSSNTASSSDYSLAMSSEVGDRPTLHHHSTASLLDSIERRTQRTYRYGIGLVCIGATLNWLGFAQGTNYHIDPLRYLGVACVLTGSFCVCISMCRWLGRPISVSGHHHVPNLEEDRSNGDVHVINVHVPMYVPSLQEEYRPTKPPDYEQIVTGEPPPYDEAIKLSPGAFFDLPQSGGLSGDVGGQLYASQLTSSAPCQTSPSHHSSHSHSISTAAGDLTRALLLDHHRDTNVGTCDTGGDGEHKSVSLKKLTPQHQLPISGRNDTEGSDPPPAYEPSPRPSISSCSSSTPLIPTSAPRLDLLPPSFSVRRIFRGGSPSRTSDSPVAFPIRRREHSLANNFNDHLHDHAINEDGLLYAQQQAAPVITSLVQQGQSSETRNENANV